jgi:hypothetical protein
MLLSMLPEPGHLGRKPIAERVGIAPLADDSGRDRRSRDRQAGRHGAVSG